MSKLVKNMLIGLLMVFLIVVKFVPTEAKSKAENIEPTIAHASGDSITFEVRVPVETMAIKQIELDNQVYSVINIPGWSNLSQAGAPQLPFLTEVLGAPFGAKIKVTTMPGKTKRLKLDAPILPALTEEVVWDASFLSEDNWQEPVVNKMTIPDPKIYQRINAFPNELSEISNDAIVRQQRLISIALYPVQYNPLANEIMVVDRLKVTVTFSGTFSANRTLTQNESPTYEAFFQDNLLNYGQALQWRDIYDSSKTLDYEKTADHSPWTPPNPGWRIKVREEGLYKMTFSELADAGVPVDTIDINTLKLFHLGTEIAIKVVEDESIFFFGEAINSKYTADNVYWLTYGGEQGLRMESLDGTPTGAASPSSFAYKEHLEEDLLYRSKVPGNDDVERFLWGSVTRANTTATTWTQSFLLDNRLNGDLTMTFSLIGYIQYIPVNPDHRASISINDTLIDDNVTWDGFTNHLVHLEIPENLLLSGINTIKITALPTDYAYDIFFIDWIELEYNRTFRAESGQLKFSYQTLGPNQFVLTDFESEHIQVYDISSHAAPKQVEHVLITGESMTYSAVFADQIYEPKLYYAIEENSLLSVFDIVEDIPSDLHSESNTAEYLMISHNNFLSAAMPLKIQKENQGLITRLIDVQDIYDEFGFGIVDIYAIQAFISYAYNSWVAPSPAYVLLIGDGHFDPKDNLGYGRTSFIPPFLANCDPQLNETAADNRYVSIIGDDTFPDLMLGRLSVNTALEAQSIIEKIIAYELTPPEGDWRHQILAVTDELEIGANYPMLSDSLLQDYYPSEPFAVEKVYWKFNYTDLTETRNAIQNAFNSGKFLVNYIGHGAPYEWGKYETLFSTDDINVLQPQDKLPIILAMTCSEGYFISPKLYSSGEEAVGEVITRTVGKGAVASWSPTGWGSIYGHDYLNRGFFKAIYQDGENIVSAATYSGLLSLWATGDNLDLLDTYLLFGDPAMRMVLNLTAVSDSYSIAEDNTLIVSAEEGVLSNDINPGNESLNAILINDVYAGKLTLNEDGSFTYIPEADYYGPDSFTYKANDGVQDSNTTTVNISVIPVNDPPVAHNQSIATMMNVPVEITLVATDDEGGGISSSIQLETLLSDRSLTYNIKDPGPTHGSLAFTAVDTVLYTPNQGFTGEDSFIFYVNDGEYDSNEAIVTITVGGKINLYLPLILK